MGDAVPGAMEGTFLHWRNQKFSVFSNSKNFKKFKKINENFIIFDNFKGNFGIFEIFLKFYWNFHENVGKNLEKFGNMDL